MRDDYVPAVELHGMVDCHHDWYHSAYAPPDHCLRCGVSKDCESMVVPWWDPSPDFPPRRRMSK